MICARVDSFVSYYIFKLKIIDSIIIITKFKFSWRNNSCIRKYPFKIQFFEFLNYNFEL